ncbi:MAG TPA: bifunctional demethylmenaquinone methyltransferase/2-methoxy-6-polyprenyl-1,4-benzoquinol methylase UbiE [Planctomycetaceae bacterium]|nr:bifunctional demethylmenaquinone methyltransferase/2-methoxy-6-polyprenyl-1,4-benzoquinol methylase UbiE [Planctomycetaceae bacterium]
MNSPAANHPVDKSGDRVRRMFGEISSRYDFLNHFLSGGTDFYWRWRTVREAPPQGEAPILDVCTGTGDLAIAYWNAGGRRTPVTGADFTPEMLEIARQKSARLSDQGSSPAGAIDWVEADTMSLPFESNRYQIVSVAFGLRNVSDTACGLREMFRVCQPGGRVVILEFSMPTNRIIRSVYGWYFRNVLPRLGQWLARNSQQAYNYLPESVGQFPQGEELADLMRAAGASQVRYWPLTLGVATLYVGRK